MSIKNDFRGDNGVFKGTARNFDGTQLPSPTNITGWTIVFTMRKSATDTAFVLQKTASIIDGPNGKYRIALSAADTAILAREYDYDIQRTDAGAEDVLSYGRLEIRQEVRTP